jgi:hypothetical protein
VADIWAFSTMAGTWAKNIRFQNKGKGPDKRLALQVALVIAEHYKKSFKKNPGIGGQGKRNTGKKLFQTTPYQRVCDEIAETKGIIIGRPIQKEAIALLVSNKPIAPYFSPDVQSLPEKKTD